MPAFETDYLAFAINLGNYRPLLIAENILWQGSVNILTADTKGQNGLVAIYYEPHIVPE
jgi:hypothetical protein